MDTEVPRELRSKELVTYTGECSVTGTGGAGYLKIISRHGIGWVSRDFLVQVEP